MATRKDQAPIVSDARRDHLKRTRDRVTSVLERAIANRSSAIMSTLVDGLALQNTHRPATLDLLKEIMEEYKQAGWTADYKEVNNTSIRVTLA
jgi:ribosomal protein S12 methylthiotransferase accessory factor YcaO